MGGRHLHSPLCGGVRKDYVTTFAAEAVVISVYLVAFKLVAIRFGSVGFAEYALSRRVLAMLAPLVVLGLDVGLARFTASAQTGRSRSPDATAVLIITSIATVVVSGVLLTSQGSLGPLLYGSGGYSDLVRALPFLLAGSAAQMVAYSYFRGRLQVQLANALMVVNHGVVPVVVLAFGPWPVPGLLIALGVSWTVVSIAFMPAVHFGRKNVGTAIGKLVRFSLPRVPGDFLQLALFAFPAIIVAHAADLRLAGVVALGIAVIGMAGSALVPISFILLPVVSLMSSRGDDAGVSRQVSSILRPAAVLLVLATIVAEFLITPLLPLLIGHPGDVDRAVLSVLVLGMAPWGVFVTLRAVLDATYFRPVNAENMALTFAAFIAAVVTLALVGKLTPLLVCEVYVAALYLLAAMTLVRSWRVMAKRAGEVEVADEVALDPIIGMPVSEPDFRSDKL